MDVVVARRVRPDRARQLHCRSIPQLEPLEDRLLLDGNGRFLFESVNGEPYRWQDAIPTTPDVIDLYYDFRDRNGVPNQISEAQKIRVSEALDLWSQATEGRLNFIPNTDAPPKQIITIGVGNLRAVGDISVPGGVVGVGGADFHITDARHHNVLQQGYAWMDSAENWDNEVGNGTPLGKVDFFAVAVHEIGHALGLGHTDGLPGPSIMDSRTTTEQRSLSATDRAQIQILYAPWRIAAASTSFYAVGADAGGGPQVVVYADGIEIRRFFAYDINFTGGVRVAVGDVNGDRVPDVISAPGPGGGPDVHIYDGRTGTMLRQWFAFDARFAGGVFSAAGDVNGDGLADVVCGADAGGGPNITAFDGTTGAMIGSFFAFDSAFTGGVRVAIGDVDGDQRIDIIAGAGPGGGPNVTVFGACGMQMLASYFAYDRNFSAGVYVGSAELNGDGKDDIIIGAGAGGGPNVSLLRGFDGLVLNSFFPYSSEFMGGVRVAGVRQHQGRQAQIMAVPGPGGGPEFRTVDAKTLLLIDDFFALTPLFAGGLFIASSR